MKGESRAILMMVGLIASCSGGSIDTCDDLQGSITYSSIEITGADTAYVVERRVNAETYSSIDEVAEVNFSDLVINVQMNWIEEQHRLRAPSTFVTSMLSWFIPSANACSLAPYYESYQPTVSRVEVYSDSDLNEEYQAGENLVSAFGADDMMGGKSNLLEAMESGSLASSREYRLEPAYSNGALVVTPVTPSRHVFTVLVTLEDGRAYESRTSEVRLSGL